MKKEQKTPEEKTRQEELAELRKQHLHVVEKLEAQGFSWDEYKEWLRDAPPKRRRG